MGAITGLSSPPDLPSLLSDHKLALFLDFDGTLVEIAAAPGSIVVNPDLNAALCELCLLYTSDAAAE